MATLYNSIVLGFLQMFVCIFGIIGNSISVVVLTRPEMKSSVNVLLLGLALADNVFLFSKIFASALGNFLLYFDVHQYEDFYYPFIWPPSVAGSKTGEHMVVQNLSLISYSY